SSHLRPVLGTERRLPESRCRMRIHLAQQNGSGFGSRVKAVPFRFIIGPNFLRGNLARENPSFTDEAALGHGEPHRLAGSDIAEWPHLSGRGAVLVGMDQRSVLVELLISLRIFYHHELIPGVDGN